jgi:uncharacterized protein
VPNLLQWGLAFRPHHIDDLLALDQPLPIEILADNYLHHQGGPLLAWTDRVAERHPILLHGVAMNIGSIDPIDHDYLKCIRELTHRYQVRVISDHLCFTRTGRHSSFELLPIVKNQSELLRIAEKVSLIQDVLQYPLTIENVSAYVSYGEDEMSDGVFLRELAAKTGCKILLDINNLYVNAHNFNFDAKAALSEFPQAAIAQMHIAGHQNRGEFLFDSHDQTITGGVWNLLKDCLDIRRQAAKPLEAVPIILENDDDKAPFTMLWDDIQKGQQLGNAFS